MKNITKKITIITLSAFILVGCTMSTRELKVEIIDSNIPKGINSLVLLNGNSYQVNQIRKSLIRYGFKVRPAASVSIVTKKTDTKDISYRKAEEKYGVKITTLPSMNNPCATNSGAVHFTEVEFEVINLNTNKTLAFISKGGRNERCPGSMVGGTTTLFNDLAKQLAEILKP